MLNQLLKLAKDKYNYTELELNQLKAISQNWNDEVLNSIIKSILNQYNSRN